MTKKEVVRITPEMAKKLLETNPNGNRKVRQWKVAQYARDMKNGDWGTEGHEISITDDGILIDGQHRLLAVVEADMPIDFWVATGVPKNTQFDVGAPRSTADSFKIGEMLNNPALATNRFASATNSFFRVMHDNTASGNLSNHERARFINNHEEELVFIWSILGNARDPMYRAPIAASYFAALECGVDREVLIAFADAVNSGLVYARSQAAAVVLRTMLLEMQYGGNGGRSQAFVASITCQALRDFADGRYRKQKYSPISTPYFDELKKRGYVA